MNLFQRRAFLATLTASAAAVASRSAMAQPVPGSAPPATPPAASTTPPAAPLVPPGAVAKPALSSAQVAAAATAQAEPAHLPQPDARHGLTFQADNGASIFYQSFGQGPPILLVHGYPLSGAMFSRVVNILAHTRTVITPDLRGYGQSKPSSTTDTIETHADDMLALMDHLGIAHATLGGMSMGGAVVLEMLRKAPARLDGLVLIDTTAAKATPQEAGMWKGLASLVQDSGMGEVASFLLPQMLSGSTRRVDQAQVSYLTRIIEKCPVNAGISGANALATRADASDLLGKIAVPTLVMVGENDALYPFETSQMMLSRIKNATLHVAPTAAHAAIFESPLDAGHAIVSWSQNLVTAAAK